MKKFISHLLLIGKDAELFVESFKDLDSVEIVRCHAMEDAVNKAYLYAKKMMLFYFPQHVQALICIKIMLREAITSKH